MPHRVSKKDVAEYEMEKKHWKVHAKWMAAKMVILGVLIFANAYWMVMPWSWFIGGVLVLAGLVKLASPGCKHCKMM